MDQHLLQRTRYLLQTRIRRLQKAPLGNFEIVAQQTLHWLESHPIIGSAILHLEQVEGDHHTEIERLLSLEKRIGASQYYHATVKQTPIPDYPDLVGYTPLTQEQHASACLRIIRAAIAFPSHEFYQTLAVYLTQEDYGAFGNRDRLDPLEAIKDHAVQELYEYLDEWLDGVNAVNALLMKYKQRVEAFERDRMRIMVSQGFGSKTGERALALHLQQYIFDQSVELMVEPVSTSGEVDFLLRDPSGQYTIIDAKLISADFAKSAIVSKIASGFNQVARYCSDYNQPTGFLAVFVDADISILLDIEQSKPWRFFRIGGHNIYYVEINISDRPSASKSGKVKQVSISHHELQIAIEDISN